MIQRHPSGAEGQGEKEPHSKGEKVDPSKIAQPSLILLLFLPGKRKNYLLYVESPEICWFIFHWLKHIF